MKKFLSLLLCVMMVVCFMPAMAWADGEETAGDVAATLPAADDNGVITLTKDVTVDETVYVFSENKICLLYTSRCV